ncbi:MAG TPA: cysteine desulfurase family protein [Acidimicrobiia bacterium]|nr:cysteine desulfurase family protein [Acidimicrobiia bacterium]
MIYLDHAATTPMRPGVWDAMAPYTDVEFGNSSGIHRVSRRAKNALEGARESIAAAIGAGTLEIVLTSGGTESDNLAIKGAVFNGGPRRGVVTAATEHEAVLETADFLRRLGMPVTVLGVDSGGRVDLDELASVVDEGTAVVSVMLLNNETGAIQDVARIVEAVKTKDPEVLVHTDAVQAFCSEPIDVAALGVDLMSLAAHKFGGPKGVGILYVREGAVLEPVQHGGGQELGRRSGTHDVGGAVGMAMAMEMSLDDREGFCHRVGQIRDDFEKRLTVGVEGLVVNTPEHRRSPHHLNVRFPGVLNETLLVRMDLAGVAASAGSACQSGASEVSHVLEAMGLTPNQARESIRFSFGWPSTIEEAEEAAEIVTDLVGKLR